MTRYATPICAASTQLAPGEGATRVVYRHVLIAYNDLPIRQMFAETLYLEAEWRGIADFSVTTTASAAIAYEHLRASKEPLLVLFGPWLVDGTGFDLLHAVGEDMTLQRHRYLTLDWYWPRDVAQRQELAALARSLNVKHLPLPCNVAQILDEIDAPVLRQTEGHA